jgi:hypothetical protein
VDLLKIDLMSTEYRLGKRRRQTVRIEPVQFVNGFLRWQWLLKSQINNFPGKVVANIVHVYMHIAVEVEVVHVSSLRRRLAVEVPAVHVPAVRNTDRRITDIEVGFRGSLLVAISAGGQAGNRDTLVRIGARGYGVLGLQQGLDLLCTMLLTDYHPILWL